MHPYFRFNDEERDAFDHDGIIELAHDEELTARQAMTFLKAHNRIYGKPSCCPYCSETTLRRLSSWFERSKA